MDGWAIVELNTTTELHLEKIATHSCPAEL
jgi:hypothetical protein